MKQRVIVSALIKRGDDYLFIKQEKEGMAYPNTLHIPGGGIEEGEDIIKALKREIKEEVALEVKDITPFDFNYDTLLYKGEITQLIFLRFLCEYESGVGKVGSDAKEILWINKNDVYNYKHNPPTLDLLSKIL
jgi:mutator protein MutT